MDRRSFLAAAAAALATPRSARAAAPKRLVAVMAEGGWDVSFCMDPKFSSPEVDGPQVDEDPDDPLDREALQTFGGIPVAVNPVKRPAVGAFFERWHGRTAVVNGIWMGAIAHASARLRIITGTQSQANPSWVAITGHVHGTDLALGSVDLSGGSYSGPLAPSTGQIGYRSQIKALLLDDATFPAPPGAGYALPQFRADDRDRELVRGWVSDRLVATGIRWSDGGRNDATVRARAEALVRARRFREEGSPTIAGLELGTAPSLVEQGDLAIELLRGDLCRAVTLDSGENWDTHDGNSGQHRSYDVLFTGVDHLVAGLDAAGLLDDTLVVVMSEFTRTPRLNSGEGKDHWPHASLLLVGGNVRGSTVYGATDDRIESRPIDLATGEPFDGGVLNKYDNVSAGILSALDVDPGEWYRGIPPFTAPFA